LLSHGGDTQYVNMHQAYDDLPAATKERIDELEAVHVFFLERMLHQLGDQVERLLVRHPDDRFDPHRIEIKSLASVLGMGAHQRMHPRRGRLTGAVLAQRPQFARAVLAQINTNTVIDGTTAIS
jgi:hypothetical protein